MSVIIHGKSYITVAERLQQVHDEKRAFEMVESGPVQVGERVLWRVVIALDGKRYIGTSEVHLNARSGIDATCPYENAETSSVGRALAFAGLSITEGIASADEVQRAECARESEREPQPPMTGVEAVEALIRSRLNMLYPQAKQLVGCKTPKEFLGYIAEVLQVQSCSASTLTISDLEVVATDLLGREHEAAAPQGEEKRGDAA